MKRTVDNWSVEKLYKERERIAFPEYQREPNLWSKQKKSLLIDSILRNIDIPKLYFNRTNLDTFEVVDGQQRLWAIWDFLDGDLKYEGAGSNTQAALAFSDMPVAQRNKIRTFELQVTTFDNADDEYLRELFIRLQLGLLLVAGEKLHALSGEMKHFIFGRFVSGSFLKGVKLPSRRYAKETLGAQIAINSFTRAKIGAFARTRYEDLEFFFHEYEAPQGQDLTFFRERTKHLVEVANRIASAFADKLDALRNRSYILSIFLLFEELLQSGEFTKSTSERKFVQFAVTLWRRLKEEGKAGIDRENRELYAFENLLSSAPGERYQIERRHETLNRFYAHFKKTNAIVGD
jgi:hypothetical protein